MLKQFSIRKYLLINLLLAIAATTMVAAISIYTLEQKELHTHHDSVMAYFAVSLKSVLPTTYDEIDIEQVQAQVNAIRENMDKYVDYKMLTLEQREIISRLAFQIWSDEGQLIAHSPSAPKERISTHKEGFVYDKMLGGKRYNLFTAYDANRGITTVISHELGMNGGVAYRIAMKQLIIMLVAFLLSGLFIWMIIGRGLRNLNQLAKELGNRQPSHLKPITLETVPVEVRSIVAALNNLFAQLEDAFIKQERFNSDAAHELRTPLAALKTHAQVALETHDVAVREKSLKRVIDSVNRSTHVVQQLLTLSRYGSSVESEVAAKLDLAATCTETASLLAPAALEKNIAISLEKESKPYLIDGYRTALGILLRNLIDNAIRYTQEGGEIKVILTQTSQHVMLRVIDNGPGIPENLRSRVLERFYRVLGNKAQGSGLGLAIVSQITKLHDAKLTLTKPTHHSGLEIIVTFKKS